MSPTGGFIDYPARPDREKQRATPVAYHHKALFVAVMAAEYGHPDDWRPIVERLLRWSLHTWDGHRHVGGIGRSSHALFGDACLVASLILLGVSRPNHQESVLGRMLLGVLQRWQGQFRPDGFIALNPADLGTPGSGWDNYMHLSVYNAWTGAIVSWAQSKVPRADRTAVPIDVDSLQPSNAADPSMEQLRVGDPGATFALVSGRGQPPQAFSRNEVELRYAGGVPLHLAWQGHVLCPAPVRVSREMLNSTPALAGWTPLFSFRNHLFGLTDFDEPRIDQDKDYVRILLSGFAMPLTRPQETGFTRRAIASLDWRLLGGALGRRAGLRRTAFPGIRGTLTYTISRDQPVLRQHLELTVDTEEEVTYMNPGGHAILTSRPPSFSLQLHHMTNRPKAFTEADLQSSACMPSAIENAWGRCLPPSQLYKGLLTSELRLTWAPGVK